MKILVVVESCSGLQHSAPFVFTNPIFRLSFEMEAMNSIVFGNFTHIAVYIQEGVHYNALNFYNRIKGSKHYQSLKLVLMSELNYHKEIPFIKLPITEKDFLEKIAQI